MKSGSMPYKIAIDGEAYTLMSDEGEFHVQLVANHVDTLIKELRAKNPHMASNRLAILAALQCASQMIHDKEQVQQYNSQSALLSEYIDKELVQDL